MTQLKPCPFCGAKASSSHCRFQSLVRCSNGKTPHCPASFGCVSIETWNNRMVFFQCPSCNKQAGKEQRDGNILCASCGEVWSFEKESRPAPLPPWRPIESAPKDGTEILATHTRVPAWFDLVIWAGGSHPWHNGNGSFQADYFTHWMPLPAAPEQQLEAVPRIVCLCGSSKWPELHHRVMMEETLAGNIVIPMGLYGHADYPIGAKSATNYGDESTAVKQMLDTLHYRKIDMAHEIIVVSKGGYFGSSTKREIAHAEATGKQVRYRDFPPEQGEPPNGGVAAAMESQRLSQQVTDPAAPEQVEDEDDTLNEGFGIPGIIQQRAQDNWEMEKRMLDAVSSLDKSKDLALCPHCGGPSRITKLPTMTAVGCPQCDINIYCTDESMLPIAISKWNRRAIPEQPAPAADWSPFKAPFRYEPIFRRLWSDDNKLVAEFNDYHEQSIGYRVVVLMNSHLPSDWLATAEELILLRDAKERQGVEIQRLTKERDDAISKGDTLSTAVQEVIFDRDGTIIRPIIPMEVSFSLQDAFTKYQEHRS